MAKVLEINNLNYGYFHNINISFDGKKFYSIVGGNNSGKTTLFKLITGLIPSDNHIICNKVPISKINNYMENVGIVERVNNNSFIYQKVKDEMTFPLYNLGYSIKEIDNRIKNVVKLFNVKFLDKNISDLSNSERQILLIILAILHKPKVLLLDNVLNFFSQKEKIIAILKKLIISECITIINFTSSLNDACFSDELILLSNFKVINECTPFKVYDDDKLFYQNGLEIPFVTDLSIKLKMYGLLKKNYCDMKEMVDDIWP